MKSTVQTLRTPYATVNDSSSYDAVNLGEKNSFYCESDGCVMILAKCINEILISAQVSFNKNPKWFGLVFRGK